MIAQMRTVVWKSSNNGFIFHWRNVKNDLKLCACSFAQTDNSLNVSLFYILISLSVQKAVKKAKEYWKGLSARRLKLE